MTIYPSRFSAAAAACWLVKRLCTSWYPSATVSADSAGWHSLVRSPLSLRSSCRLSLVVLFLLGASHAAAFCLPYAAHITVGADTANCTFNDIQSAIDVVGASTCPTVIDITREHTYTNQHLIINNKPNLTLQGWGDGVTCSQVPNFFNYTPPDSTAPLVSLDGSSDGNGRVLTITGTSNVSLRNLTVTRGSPSADASGGGINFDGQGSLELTRSTVSYNNAGFGAGINVNGSIGPATLTLDPDTLILLNTASTSGGGIRMQGNSRLYALQAHTLIGYNHASDGYGGGLEVLGPARADIGSSGYFGLGVIYHNDASYGGGIDILTFEDKHDAVVRLFTTDSHNPVQIVGNFASHAGGAVYLRPLLDVSSRANSVLCAYDFRINGNSAQEGAAIYSDADYSTGFFNNSNGGTMVLNIKPNSGVSTVFCAQTEAPPALGAVACAAGVACNEFVGNSTVDTNNQPTPGSTILLQTASNLYADRFSARSNTGAHLVRELGDGNVLTMAVLSNCLLADNTLTQELIAQTGGSFSDIDLDSCTIAGNQIGAPYVFLAPGYAQLHNSIIDQPGRATVDPPITNPGYAAYVLSNDRSTLPGSAYIQAGEATFVDAANGDYHLQLSSLGIDYAPMSTSNSEEGQLDLDRNPRIVDLPGIPNHFGAMDLGAYEHSFTCAGGDTIFCNGFEP